LLLRLEKLTSVTFKFNVSRLCRCSSTIDIILQLSGKSSKYERRPWLI
jgi:hypothetical protein